jgi:hypothetical protein
VNQQDRHRLLSQAIWLRDNADSLTKTKVFELIRELDEFSALSIRQISGIVGNKISNTTLCKYLTVKPRVGGRLNPKSLEDIAQCLSDKENNLVDYRIVKRILLAGTSQNTLSRLTGINQSLISKKARV